MQVRLYSRRGLYAAGAAALAVALVLTRIDGPAVRANPALTQSLPASKDLWKNFHYQDATACTQCHSLPTPATRGSFDLCIFSEWSVWKTLDKHAQAYAVLKGERGRKMGELLFPNMEKAQAHEQILKVETGCMGCHAMGTLPGRDKDTMIDPEDGVSCTGCHGPSGGDGAWLGPHQQRTWRAKSPEDKFKMGLRDLRDPVIRAELCLSCHIGNAGEGKVVSHSMMAAGHPPLPPIDVATFSRNEPQHWRDARNVPYLKQGGPDVWKQFGIKDPEFQGTQLAVIGNVVAVRETMKLVKDRANFDGPKSLFFPELAMPGGNQSPKERWPEIAMAHSDCFACHHDLRYPGFRQERGFRYHVPGLELTERVIPGRPMVRNWPFPGVVVGVRHSNRKLDSLAPLIGALTKATSSRPFGDPAQMATSADGLIKWTDDLLLALRKDSSWTRESVVKIAKELCNLYDSSSGAAPDAETARQIASMVSAICDDLGVKGDALTALRSDMNTEPYRNREKRQEVMADVIRDALKKPKTDDPFNADMKKFFEYVKDFGDEKTTETMLGNQFLGTLFLQLGNKDFTASLLKKEFADQLQRLSDDEQKTVLTTIANYSPRKFLERLKAVEALLPKN